MRQLSNYRFARILNGTRDVYEHTDGLFERGRPEMVEMIVRRPDNRTEKRRRKRDAQAARERECGELSHKALIARNTAVALKYAHGVIAEQRRITTRLRREAAYLYEQVLIKERARLALEQSKRRASESDGSISAFGSLASSTASVFELDSPDDDDDYCAPTPQSDHTELIAELSLDQFSNTLVPTPIADWID